MKSLLYVSILFCAISIGNAQSKDDKAVIPDGWNKSGQITFLFNQSAFNKEWQGGGLSSYAGNLSVNYNFNYKKADLVWDNKIMGVYGLTKINGAPRAVKSDDRLEFTSLVGKKVNDFWYYSGFLNFQSQFDSGFNTLGIRTSHAFSPAYLQAGPGILWKKSNNLFVNIAPATARIIYVDRQFTEFGSSFGVGQGKTIRFELGASVAAYYKTNLMENISFENIMNLYLNYLDKPQNLDVNYQLNLVMKVNKYISANLAFQAIYDDNAVKAVQVREVFGLSVNYGF